MAKKLKKYVIFISRTYPAYHSKKAQKTYFKEKIEESLGVPVPFDYGKKIHTFRGNYTLWKKRIDEVLEGNAVIVLKYHTLGRYVKGNEQIEFARLDKDSGVGIEKVVFAEKIIAAPHLVPANMKNKCKLLSITEVSRNDGLDYFDFKDWFEKGDYDLKETFACVHFTSFRYGKALPPKK